MRRFHVIEYHLPKHLMVLVYMVRAFYANHGAWATGLLFQFRPWMAQLPLRTLDTAIMWTPST
jgi:hypothetical protein